VSSERSEPQSTTMSGDLSRSELLARLKALRLERASGSSSSSSPDPSTSGHDVNGNNGARVMFDNKMGMPAIIKQLRQRRMERSHANKMTKLASEQTSNAERLNQYFAVTDLEKKIIRQVEYYFGDHNLPRDRFMKSVMESNDGWIPMETMMTFKRLAALTTDPDHVMTAMEKSVNKIVQVDLEARQMRRDPSNPPPDKSQAAERIQIQERTVYVTGFDRDGTTLDHMLEFFEGKFEKVSNVRMRYRRNNDSGGDNNPEVDHRQFLGSVFVTFDSLGAAQDFLKIASSGDGLFHAGRKVTAKSQKEFLDGRHEDNDEFHLDKISRTVFVQGFDKADMSDKELIEFFVMFNGAEMVKKRVFRDHSSSDDNEGVWRFSGSVFVTFDSVASAKAFYLTHSGADGRLPLTYKGDKLVIKWQKDYYQEKGKFRRDLKMLTTDN